MAAMEQAPIYSTLTDDPDLGQLVEQFVSILPQRMTDLVEAMGANDLSTLRRLAHQLKQAGGGCGFEAISQAAGELEASSKNAQAVAELTGQVQLLVHVCQRASKDSPR